MPRHQKTVYERMCPACRKLLRTRPREVAQAAILHIQISAYAEQARKERERLAAQAQKAAASGKVEKAADLEQRAAAVVAPVIHREPPKVTGVATREVWKFEVTDPAAVPREYLMVDEKKLGAVVRAMKGDTNIPGVRVWSEKSLAAGAV